MLFASHRTNPKFSHKGTGHGFQSFCFDTAPASSSKSPRTEVERPGIGANRYSYWVTASRAPPVRKSSRHTAKEFCGCKVSFSHVQNLKSEGIMFFPKIFECIQFYLWNLAVSRVCAGSEIRPAGMCMCVQCPSDNSTPTHLLSIFIPPPSDCILSRGGWSPRPSPIPIHSHGFVGAPP